MQIRLFSDLKSDVTDKIPTENCNVLILEFARFTAQHCSSSTLFLISPEIFNEFMKGNDYTDKTQILDFHNLRHQLIVIT